MPTKKLDGHMIATLPYYGNRCYVELSERVIFLKDLPPDMTSDDIVNYFSSYGEIEEGPAGLCKQAADTEMRFAFIAFKTVEAARSSLEDADKNVMNGHRFQCMAVRPDSWIRTVSGSTSGHFSATIKKLVLFLKSESSFIIKIVE